MKKFVFLIFVVLLVSSIAFVYAIQGNGQGQGNQNQSQNQNKIGKQNITFVPWQKRNESECLQGCKCVGAVVSCPTEDGKIMTIEAGRSGNIITITVNRTEVNTTLEVETENETEALQNRTQNRTKLKAKLSNGRKAEIKIMPDTASEKAIERLGELNFTIELKEVGKGNETQLAYELQAERHMRILGLFRAKAKVKAQISAETGEIIIVKKPWWAFLASEAD